MKHIKHILIILIAIISINTHAALVSVKIDKTSVHFAGTARLTDSTLTLIVENGNRAPGIHNYVITHTYSGNDVFKEYTMSPADSRNDNTDIYVRTIDNTMSIYNIDNVNTLPNIVIQGYTDATSTADTPIIDMSTKNDSSGEGAPSWVWPTVGIILIICTPIIVTAYLMIRIFIPRV